MVSVYLYVPNLIGYARIILCIWAFYYSFTDCFMFFFLYGLSAALDMADGHAARLMGQTSNFGAVLDQVTDRAATASLIVVLSHFYPQYTLGFVALNAIDLVSHFARLYSSLTTNKTSHKAGSASHPWLLRLYYENRIVLASVCGGNELFYCLLYLRHFTAGPVYEGHNIIDTALLFCAPVWALKNLLNLLQLQHAMIDLVDDEESRKGNGKAAVGKQRR